MTFNCKVIKETSLHVGLTQHIYRMKHKTVERIDILTLTEFLSWHNNEKYWNLWQTEHLTFFCPHPATVSAVPPSFPLRCTFAFKSTYLRRNGFSERKNFLREICVCGKWKPFLMSRSRFRSGNNTRKERYLSAVGRRKINAYKPLLGSAGVEVITERGLQGLCIETIHEDTAAQQTGVKKYDSCKHPH
jgi:hypothetical protein